MDDTSILSLTVFSFKRHSRGRDNWSLNRGSPEKTLGVVQFSIYKYKQMQVEKKDNNDGHNNT